MSDWLMRVIKAEAKQLISLAAEDLELRADLRALAREILAATEETGVQHEPVRGDSHTSAAEELCEPEANATIDETAEPLRELTLGRPVTSGGKPGGGSASVVVSRGGVEKDELGEIESRCRWKAEAAGWALERVLRSREGNDRSEEDPPSDPRIAERVEKFIDCYYWAKPAEPSGQADLALLDDAGGSFEALAEGLASARTALERNQSAKAVERVLSLVAEAQSAVRNALKRLGVTDDPDQLEVFEWVKATAARHRIYLKRFMRADDAGGSCRLGGSPRAHRSNGGERATLAATGGRSRTNQRTLEAHRSRREPGAGMAGGHSNRGRTGCWRNRSEQPRNPQLALAGDRGSS